MKRLDLALLRRVGWGWIVLLLRDVLAGRLRRRE
jgi:hypothetical protein